MPGDAWSARAVALCMVLGLAAEVQAQVKGGVNAHAEVDDQEARDLFRLGKQAFDEGRFERALKYFKDAYDLSGRAQLQFNIGTVLDRLRRDREAITAYRSYLGQVPDAANRTDVEQRIRLLEDALTTPEPPAVHAPEPSASTLPPPNATAPQPQAAVPTPEQTARASMQPESHDSTAQPQAATAPESSTPLSARWWFWTGIGAVVVGGVVTGLVLGSSSSARTVDGPAVLGASTRVRPL